MIQTKEAKEVVEQLVGKFPGLVPALDPKGENKPDPKAVLAFLGSELVKALRVTFCSGCGAKMYRSDARRLCDKCFVPPKPKKAKSETK